ncbi:hypothetical protein B0O99DRAFT_600383 [Bisporella sp. PMI_857]|nr:hypothetical protein B0O99DRAFT_600383 [Bisporella sp. PMI_857]
MTISYLRIVSPCSHDIYFNSSGDDYSPRLFLSLSVTTSLDTRPADLIRFNIRLIRVVSPKANNLIATTSYAQHFVERIYRRFSIKSTSADAQLVKSCSAVEEVTQDVLTHLLSPIEECANKGRVLNLPFSMPIPTNIPGTSKTAMGTISYAILVTATTIEGQTISASQQIHLARRLISDYSSIQHIRSFPNSKVIANLTLSQNITTQSRSKLSFCTTIFFRQPFTPAERDTEFKCVTVRELRWRVEETIKLIGLSDGDGSLLECVTCKRCLVRELCSGCQKEYWGTQQNPIVMAQKGKEQGDCSVNIIFGFNISKRAEPAQQIDISFYKFNSGPLHPHSLPPDLHEYSPTTKEQLAITVEHRLKIDIIMGEDTFQKCTGDLVDRKLPWKGVSASIPICISDIVELDIAREALLGSSPPSYSGICTAPPEYVHQS